MKVSRRTLLLSGGAIIAIAALPSAKNWLTTRRYLRKIDAQFSEVFGTDIASLPAAKIFLSDYKDALQGGLAFHNQHRLTLSFMQSSNVIEHHEIGAELNYDSLFDPYVSPCSNRLSFIYSFDENDN